jgi:protein required for attachment to host cells
MKKLWVVVANASMARIFSLNKHKDLKLVKELNHPDSRKKDTELVSDIPGQFRARGGVARGNFCARTEPKKVQVHHFAQEVAETLEHGRKTNLFDFLVLITLPGFQGTLKEHFNNHLLNKIKKVIPKDFHNATEKELMTVLQAR